MASSGEVSERFSFEAREGPGRVLHADERDQRQRERIRLKNQMAQKKYREKKREEQRTLHSRLADLETALSAAEAERCMLEAEVHRLQRRLSADAELAANERSTTGEEVYYVPAREGYKGLHPLRQRGIVLEATFQPAKRLSWQAVARLALSDHCELRKEMVIKAGQLLLSNPERDPNCEEGLQLKVLMMEMHGYEAYMAKFHPTMLHRLTSCRADGCESPSEPPGRTHWANILKKLRLSAEQEASLLDLYASTTAEMGAILVGRERLRQLLMAHLAADQSTARGYTEDRRQMVDRLRWAGLVRAVRDNLDSFHVETCKFCTKSGSLWGLDERVSLKGLDFFQDAQMLTLAWPYHPYRYDLVAELAAQRGLGSPARPPDDSAPADVPEAADEPYKSLPMKLLEAFMEEKLTLKSY